MLAKFSCSLALLVLLAAAGSSRPEAGRTLEGEDLPVFFCVTAFLLNVDVAGGPGEERKLGTELGLERGEWRALMLARATAQRRVREVGKRLSDANRSCSDGRRWRIETAPGPVVGVVSAR